MALFTPAVEPLWIARYDYGRGDVLPAHSHDDYFQLIAIVDGSGEALVDSLRFPLEPGQVYFLRPRLSHGLEASLRRSVRTLDTKFTIADRGLRAACGRLAPVHQDPDRRIPAILDAMHAEAQGAGPLSSELCQTLLLEVLLLLLRREHRVRPAGAPEAGEARDGADLPGRVHRHLRERCGERIGQRNLGRTFGMTYRHLYERYRARYGESPLAALRRFRMERARQLMRYSDYELKRISAMAGFATVQHFTRVFTAASGEPPAKWRSREAGRAGRNVVIRPGFVNPILVRSGPGYSRPDLHS